MAILYRIAQRFKPTPVRKTVVLFDGGHQARTPGFGAGLLPPDGRTPEGVAELEELDREPVPPLPVDAIDWDELGRQARIQELAEAGYRFF